jgi:hypothetical protein
LSIRTKGTSSFYNSERKGNERVKQRKVREEKSSSPIITEGRQEMQTAVALKFSATNKKA